MEANEIIQVAIGRGQDGSPNSSVTFLTEMWDKASDTFKEVSAKSMYKPEVQIQRRGDFVQVDLIFFSELDNDLKIVWHLLENYGALFDKIEPKSTVVPINTLTILPIEYDGEFYIVGSHPKFWALQPKRPGEQHNVLRILFENDNFLFYAAENIDFATIEAEAEREIENREQMMLAAEIEAAKKQNE